MKYQNNFLVNEKFLSNFSDKASESISKKAYEFYLEYNGDNIAIDKKDYFNMSTEGPVVMVLYCPKCKTLGYFINPFGTDKAKDLKFCGVCGEDDIYFRLQVGIEKINVIIELYNSIERGSENVMNILCQQIIVLMTSTYESFLRNFYINVLNIKYVVSNYTLVDKFLKDCKNDFLNAGKTQDRLSKDIFIDYKNIIGKDNYKLLQFCFECRNVIVHNNGICDKIFISQHKDYEGHRDLKLEFSLVYDMYTTMLKSIVKIQEVYDKIVLDALILNLSK